jgi:hypothetical protein
VKPGDRIRLKVRIGSYEPGTEAVIVPGDVPGFAGAFAVDGSRYSCAFAASEVEPVEPEAQTILDEAAQLVNGDRQRDYGHPKDNLARIASLWSGILDRPVTAKEVGLCMVALKLAREVATPKRDNIVDAAGYLRMLEAAGEVGS